MKKKGLIISTVVMVVVLIASLTTATYAWISASSTVQVNPISLAVRSATNVQVGVKFQKWDVPNDSSNYYYNTVTANGEGNAVSWNGTDVGLGTALDFDNLQLGGSMAIGTSNYGEAWSTTNSVDATTNILGKNTVNAYASKYIIKAKGVSDTSTSASENKTTVDYTEGNVSLAQANVDYLDATIGIAANQDNVNGLYAKIVVKTDGVDATLGINAAIHFVIKIGDKYADIQPFGNLKYNTTINTTNITGANGGKLSATADSKVATSEFYFWISQKDSGSFKKDGTEIVDFKIYAYIDGTDPDCVLDAKGGCTISITFGGTTSTDSEKLEDGTPIVNVTFIEIDTDIA